MAGLAIGLLAAAVQAQPGAPCVHPRTQQDLPQVLGPSFVRYATHSFEAQAPGQGCSVRYRHPSGMWADVYIYRAGLGSIDDVPRDPRLMTESQQAFAGITYMWEKQQQAKVQEPQARYEKRGQAGVEVLVGSTVIEPPGKDALRSHVQVWSGGGSIWKLRATFPKADQAASDPAVQALGEALVDLSREAPQ